MVLQHAQHAFVDAFGNPDLDTKKPGASTHYIITAVIADEPALVALRERVDGVRASHFQTGEMKSSKVGPKDERRLHVLRDLCAVDGWHFFANAIAKAELSGDFEYKKSFVKALHGDVFRKLYDAYPVVRIVCDELGGQPFH